MCTLSSDFRVRNPAKHTPSNLQAVALVFEHVGAAHDTRPGTGAEEAAEVANGRSEGEAEDGIQRKGSAKLAQQGAANAALKLLDDLCMMATGD